MSNLSNSPEQTVKMFFDSLNDGDTVAAWNLLSSFSQNSIIDDLFNRLQSGQNVPEESKKLTREHIRVAFENAIPGLADEFWKSFSEASYVKSISNHAVFQVSAKFQDYIVVDIIFNLPNLQQVSIPLKVIKEDSDWKIAYIESGKKS